MMIELYNVLLKSNFSAVYYHLQDVITVYLANGKKIDLKKRRISRKDVIIKTVYTESNNLILTLNYSTIPLTDNVLLLTQEY